MIDFHAGVFIKFVSVQRDSTSECVAIKNVFDTKLNAHGNLLKTLFCKLWHEWFNLSQSMGVLLSHVLPML